MSSRWLSAFILILVASLMMARAQTINPGGGSGTGIGVGRVVSNAAPSNPTGTTSATAVMMGLGVAGAQTCSITPQFSTRVLFSIQGNAIQATVSNTTTVALRTGTGTPPANQAALTGVLQTNPTNHIAAVASTGSAFNHVSIVTGLAIGVLVWFDMQVSSAGGGLGSINSITCNAAEL